MNQPKPVRPSKHVAVDNLPWPLSMEESTAWMREFLRDPLNSVVYIEFGRFRAFRIDPVQYRKDLDRYRTKIQKSATSEWFDAEVAWIKAEVEALNDPR